MLMFPDIPTPNRSARAPVMVVEVASCVPRFATPEQRGATVFPVIQ